MSSITNSITDGLQLNPETAEVLGRFDRRRRLLLSLRGIASAVVTLLVAISVIAIIDYVWIVGDFLLWILGAFAYLGAAAMFYSLGIRPLGDRDAQQVARQVEATDSSLREDLLSAVELADPTTTNGSLSLRRVLQESVATRASRLDMGHLLPVGLIQRWLISALVLLVLFAGLLLVPDAQFGRRIARAMLPGFAIQRASLTELTILKPSPASGFVAEGDAVAVVVEVGGQATDEVTLQWRNEDGLFGEIPMTPRVAPSTYPQTGTIKIDNRFAANLSLGAVPLHYRVLGGDGVTLWETLTPLPRPRVVNFNKRYLFPDYSMLSPRVEDAEHGDLEALVGTQVELTVRFDEPVSDAVIHYDDVGGSRDLSPIGDGDVEFRVSVPVRTPETYQIDAVSIRSGLNSPYSPQYSIDPLRDSSPIARWASEMDRMMIVSPLDVIQMRGVASDDLPIDRVIQEFQINGKPAMVREIDVPESDRELDLTWHWDLLHRKSEQVDSIKLQNGDFIRTRFVVIDRNSQRGESALLEILIADEGFDANRHQHLEDVTELLRETSQWSMRLHHWMKTMGEMTVEDAVDRVDEGFEDSEKLGVDVAELLTGLEGAIGQASHLPEAGSLELLGISLVDVSLQQKTWMAETFDLVSDSAESWAGRRTQLIEKRIVQARNHANEALRVDRYARNLLAQHITVAMLKDANSLRVSLKPLLRSDEVASLPVERFPRYLFVSMGRLKEINQLLDAQEDSIPDNTMRHFEGWKRFSDSWLTRLESAIENPPSEEAFRTIASQFDQELKDQTNGRMIDGQIGSTLQSLLRELRAQTAPTRDRVRGLAVKGREGQAKLAAQNNQTDSAKLAALQREHQFVLLQFNQEKDQIQEWLKRRESLERSRENVDLTYAADTRLMQRAFENVTKQGFEPYQDKPAAEVYEQIAQAYQIIESAHSVRGWLQELTHLLLRERRLEGTAINKVLHPTWLERFSTGLEFPVRLLRESGVPPELTSRIGKTRDNSDYNLARDRILKRRWSGEVMLTAETPLQSMQWELQSAVQDLEPHVDEARRVLQQYVLSLSDQARQAAREAEEAKERTESREDSKEPTAGELAREQKDVEKATRQTLESLVDLANTASLIDQEERELALDADLAAAEIQSAAQEAESLMQEANRADTDEKRSELLDQTADALGELAESLQQTAEHFELAEQNADLSESREALRQDSESSPQGELEQRYDEAEDLASAAQQSPEEMLRELERELQQNQPMQEELSDISRRATESAQRALDEAAKQERGVAQAMERADTSFQERKNRAVAEMASITQRAQAVDQALLAAAERAIGWANTPEARPDLEATREALKDAIEQSQKMRGAETPLSEMQAAAQKTRQAIREASQAAKQLNQETTAAQTENIHQDESSRRRTETQVERFARDARSQQLRSIAEQKKQWAAAEQQANQRIQEAQRQKRDADNQLRQEQQKLSQNPDAAAQLQPQIDAAQDRVRRAERAEQSAKETKDFAAQRKNQTQERENEIKSQPIKPLDQMNPAAEFAAGMSQEAGEELAGIDQALDQLSQQMNFGDQLDTPKQTLDQVAAQQQQLEERVNEALGQLERAARHEERLGQDELADQLNAAAQSVSDNALSATQEAASAIQKASEQSNESAVANQEVDEAADAIQSAANSLADLLETSMQPENAMAQADSQATASDAQQNASENDSSQPASSDSASSQPSGSQPSGSQPSGSQPSGSQPASSDSASSQPSGSQPSQELSPDQQLAQTLDELDRQIASQSQANAAAAAGAQDPQTASNDSTDPSAEVEGSESQGADSPGSPTQGMPTAQQASPTLANNVNSQAQQAARQRQQQLNPQQGQSGEPGQPSQQQNASSSPSNQSGNGEMPDGGPIDASEIERLGADWGRLRERKTDEVNEGRTGTVSAAYRRQVEAYFRAIARRAAQNQASSNQD